LRVSPSEADTEKSRGRSLHVDKEDDRRSPPSLTADDVYFRRMSVLVMKKIPLKSFLRKQTDHENEHAVYDDIVSQGEKGFGGRKTCSV
jgi:hypothetical protein